MLSFIERVKTWWTTADPKQRVVTLGGIGALLLVLLGTATFVTRPHYETLFDNLSETQKAEIVETLKAGNGGFDPQIGTPGAIELPQGQIAAARLKVAQAGKLPKGANHWGANELAKGGLLTSPGTEAQMLNTVREGEIATALETMQGVASASVLITAPKERLFAEDQSHPTASVSIVENGEGGLTAANGRTIANLVCSAVDGMTPADVVVVSNTLGELWNGRNGGVATDKWDQDKKVARDVESQIQSALDFSLGTGNTKVLVRADVNNGEHSITTDTDEPSKKPVATVKEVEDMQNGRKGGVGGGAGATANTGGRALNAAPDDGGGAGAYKKTGNQNEYGHNQAHEVSRDGQGGLKGLAISVIANSDKVPDESKVKAIVDGVMGGLVQTDATGAPLRNQPFTTTVTSMKFDGSTAQAAKDAADRLAGQQRTQQLLSLLPIAAILAVALLVAKQVARISKSVLPPPPAPALPERGEEGGALAEGPAALEGGMDLGILPEASFLDGLADQFDKATAKTLAMNYGLEEEDLPPALRPIKDRVDRPLDTLKMLAEQRPELVATLIKSVILGEKI